MTDDSLDPAFKSHRDYYHFRREVVKSRRYIGSPETVAFLQAVAATCHARETIFKVGAGLRRAQVAHGLRPIYQTGDDGEYIHIDDIECAANKARMMPLPDRAGDGRVNPRGIPCLYMATNDATAVSEVRPAIGAYVTVAVMKCLRELKLIDCSVLAEKQFIYFKEPERAEMEEAVWSDINRAFSAPVDRSDDAAEYAPTQILSELFRSLGYDGVAYKSAFGEDGYNVAIFNIDDFEVGWCRLFKVKDITHKIEQQPD
ncbi:RES domain-containing protein [Aminobacter aminovorans]|uniref:RES domain n=1 Tax=Aminobacter aminovorans TaxID=83263 RepID=A0A380WPF4_AMIAI|nr:RES family NAD+ phosphorylase [Aminobacter aminovorans]TCS29988.1 RES domain-containing protein [Aminobacter aminovorans]SUU90837.1 RES domain [Aminobacter aminovorans]